MLTPNEIQEISDTTASIVLNAMIKAEENQLSYMRGFIANNDMIMNCRIREKYLDTLKDEVKIIQNGKGD